MGMVIVGSDVYGKAMKETIIAVVMEKGTVVLEEMNRLENDCSGKSWV